MVIKTDVPDDEGVRAVAVDEEAAEFEAEVVPLLVCMTINFLIHACCSGGVGAPPGDAIDWRVEAGEACVVDLGKSESARV